MSHSTPTNKTTFPLRRACIDCGTNSIKLVVADLSAYEAHPVYEDSATTRIGEGMPSNGMYLNDEPMRRTLEAIETFSIASRAHGAEETALIGTAALRDAQNRDEFVRRVRERCGLTLEVISGEEEARLSFLAVRRDPHWRHVPRLLVIDIGGGSTELIQGAPDSDRVQSRISVNLGAVKLTEAHLRSDPPTADELTAAREIAALAFRTVPFVEDTKDPFHVVGVGGTLTNLGAMKLHAAVDPERLHGLSLQMPEIEALCSRLANLTVENRRKLPGLDPRRADIILAGTILLMHALAHIHSDRIDVSTRGLRWGVLYDRFLPAIES